MGLTLQKVEVEHIEHFFAGRDHFELVNHQNSFFGVYDIGFQRIVNTDLLFLGQTARSHLFKLVERPLYEIRDIFHFDKDLRIS